MDFLAQQSGAIHVPEHETAEFEELLEAASAQELGDEPGGDNIDDAEDGLAALASLQPPEHFAPEESEQGAEDEDDERHSPQVQITVSI